MAPQVSCTAFVRQPGRAWRDAPIEMVTLDSTMCIDREFVSVGTSGESLLRPACRGLVIDGSPCARFRLSDGRMAAVTITFCRGLGA